MHKLERKVDERDKQILHYACRGENSYQDIGKQVGISRKTVSRRIQKLKEDGIIEKKNITLPNFEKLGYSAIVVGMNVGIDNLDKSVNILKNIPNIKLLWKTYGEYDIVAVLLCEKKDTGDCIAELKELLADKDIELREINVSPSSSWEKMDLTPEKG